MMAAPAMAQDANVQRVEITGSSIKRATAETASPVQLITRDDLMKSGKATVAEYLQTLTADGAGSLPTGFGNGFAAGSTAISLRGLGATSTLVLLNGRRMAPFARADDGQKSFTDLSPCRCRSSNASKSSRMALRPPTARTPSPASSTSSCARTSKA
ncbi:TonB-dependent receptor plug domain-containing protein [Janthinobacterium lividum]